MQLRWRVVPGSSFHWRHWDGEHVLYHEQSGDTHRLNGLGRDAIRHLAEQPLGADQLGRRLTAEADRNFPAGDLPALLAFLQDVGLVEPVNDTGEPDPA